MHRGFLLLAGALTLFVGAVLYGTTNDAFGLVTVTPYEADVNENGQVNSTDLMLVAQRFGQPVPTATSVAITSLSTYVVSSPLNAPQSGSAYCDPGDRVTGGGADGVGNPAFVNRAADYSKPIANEGWEAYWHTPYGGETVFAVCLDNMPSHQ